VARPAQADHFVHLHRVRAALLLVGFSLLCGLLLFYNFSSYLVHSRLRALSDQAKFFAQSTALEIQRSGGRDVAGILARRQANAAGQYQGVSFAVVPMDSSCAVPRQSRPAIDDARLVTAGPWTHLPAPRSVRPGSTVPDSRACSRTRIAA